MKFGSKLQEKYPHLYNLSTEDLLYVSSNCAPAAAKAAKRILAARKPPTQKQRIARSAMFTLGSVGGFQAALSRLMYETRFIADTAPISQEALQEAVELRKTLLAASAAAEEVGVLLRKRFCKAPKEETP